jgi:hypothetical protein
MPVGRMAVYEDNLVKKVTKIQLHPIKFPSKPLIVHSHEYTRQVRELIMHHKNMNFKSRQLGLL